MFLTKYLQVWPLCLNYRGITAKFLASENFGSLRYMYFISQGHEAPLQNVKNEDYDSAGNYIGGANSDIFKRINAMLDNTLDLANIAPLSTEQNTRKAIFFYFLVYGPSYPNFCILEKN